MQRLKACAFETCSPRSQIMRVITGSRPGVSGRRISPVQRRLWKTAPNGAWSPIFCATCNNPSGVVRVGAGTVMARRGKAHEISATTQTEERNIRPLLLRKRSLSRGDWRSGAGSTEGKFRRPRQERRKGDIEKPALKHEQERYRQELPVGNREPDKVAEVDREGQFCDRQRRF